MKPPVRVCCGQRHLGVICPDGLVMCCICFNRVAISFLNIHEGERENVCKKCAKEGH